MDKAISMKKCDRIAELDVVRGICILLMLWDHFALIFIIISTNIWEINRTDSLFGLYQNMMYYMTSPVRTVVRTVVLILFFVVAGISTQLSRNNLKRCCKLSIVALVITGLTAMVSIISDRNFYIWFGIMHCYAFCVFIYWSISKLNNSKLEFIFYLILMLLSIVFIFWNPVTSGTNILLPIGIPSKNYVPAFDYFPIFPYIGAFVLGVFIGKAYYLDKKTKIKIFEYPLFLPIKIVGRNGLIIYPLHLIIIVGVILLVGVFCL